MILLTQAQEVGQYYIFNACWYYVLIVIFEENKKKL